MIKVKKEHEGLATMILLGIGTALSYAASYGVSLLIITFFTEKLITKEND